ncbi:phosphomannomutase/phosphoglucomutase [Gaopeijia maritima]|uniref:Phosphomannomutase/phosphoglucomutase n=1 Tax=Gaopeijia maritima TaxID=3119007 RepID=A0ABU9E8S9_9BACT
MPAPAAHIFRQYDVRGIVGSDLDAEVAGGVGRAYAADLREAVSDRTPRVVVGRDNRPSSPALADALVAGLRSGGVDVLDIGTVPTPMVWWAEKSMKLDGAIQITGSHNPAEWNGIKMTMAGGSVYGDTIQGLRRRIVESDFADGQGALEERDIYDDYVTDLTGRFELARPMKVVVDCGNGSGALVAERLLEAVGVEVVPLFCTSDGTFPNHHPDPTVDENLVDLIAKVKESGADLGVAFDGDADRVGAVDEHGQVVRGDLIVLLFGLDLMERTGRSEKLVFDVKCSQVLPEVFGAAGGEPIMWMTGHSLMKEKMKETGAALAGELSGHICVGGDEYFGFDDALYDALYLITLLSRSEKTLSERVAAFPAYVSTPEIRIDVTEESKFGLVEKAQEHFTRDYEVIDVDGARILFGDGWGLIRASNTQPVLVSRYEARSEERLAEIRAVVEGWLEEQGVSV